MDRDIQGDTAEALSSPRLLPIALVLIDFDSGQFPMWTGPGDLRWNGITWKGAGTLGTIGAIEESAEQRAIGVDLTVSGVPAEVLDIALAEDWQGRDCTIYFAVLDDERRFVGEPFVAFGGFVDRMVCVFGTENAVTVTIESDDIDLERTMVRRYTAEDQRSEYLGDKFCDAVATIQEVDVKWGRGFEKDT